MWDVRLCLFRNGALDSLLWCKHIILLRDYSDFVGMMKCVQNASSFFRCFHAWNKVFEHSACFHCQYKRCWTLCSSSQDEDEDAVCCSMGTRRAPQKGVFVKVCHFNVGKNVRHSLLICHKFLFPNLITIGSIAGPHPNMILLWGWYSYEGAFELIAMCRATYILIHGEMDTILENVVNKCDKIIAS